MTSAAAAQATADPTNQVAPVRLVQAPHGRTGLVSLLGPALVAGIAYIDPGNVASNMTAGARYGFLLVWVVVLGNLVAWLIQYLSAKLGLVTGLSLAEILGERITSPWGRRGYWLQAELVAMATDVAEVIGGAVALGLLFNLPLLAGGAITGAVSIVVLATQSRGRQKSFERVIISMLVIIVIGFCAGVVRQPPAAASVIGGLAPRFDGASSLVLAASILGATIMPHAIYAHSALVRDRFRIRQPGLDNRQLLSATRWDVTIALTIAGTVNLALILLAAGSLRGIPGTESLEGAQRAISTAMGNATGTAFALALLASGLASTSVGAYAGGEIMRGLLKMRIPTLIRRLVTIAPALFVLGVGVDPTRALVMSQVVLSFGIPFALIPLVWLTAHRSVLGAQCNRIATTVAGALATTLLIVLNAALLATTF